MRTLLVVCIYLLCSNVILWSLEADLAPTEPSTAFVWPGNGVAKDMPIWGMRDGLRISIVKTKGPQGLIRVHATYLNVPLDRVVNFISIEPSVLGEKRRGQSELEMSRVRKLKPGEQIPQRKNPLQGLSFYASNSKDSYQASGDPVTGKLSKNGERLSVFIHTETFKNGSRPVVEVIFRKGFPKTIELRTYAAKGSAKMEFCALSATMGNYTILRRLHVKARIVRAENMWQDEKPGAMDFYSWRHWQDEQLLHLPDGRPYVYATSNYQDAKDIPYLPKLRNKYWHYTGTMTGQFWCGEADPKTTASVNARSVYWKSKLPIPGGASFENYEMRAPFKSGRRFWYGIIEGGPHVDVKKLPIPPLE